MPLKSIWIIVDENGETERERLARYTGSETVVELSRDNVQGFLDTMNNVHRGSTDLLIEKGWTPLKINLTFSRSTIEIVGDPRLIDLFGLYR